MTEPKSTPKATVAGLLRHARTSALKELEVDGRPFRDRSVKTLCPELRAAHEMKERDREAIRELLSAIGMALLGGSWAGVRRAHAALNEDDRGREERLLRALGVCDEALGIWKTGLGRKSGEKTAAHLARLAQHDDAQQWQAKALVNGVAREDPKWGRPQMVDVLAVLKLEGEKTSPSPGRLLRSLGAFAATSDNSIKKVLKKLRQQKRQSGT